MAKRFIKYLGEFLQDEQNKGISVDNLARRIHEMGYKGPRFLAIQKIYQASHEGFVEIENNFRVYATGELEKRMVALVVPRKPVQKT